MNFLYIQQATTEVYNVYSIYEYYNIDETTEEISFAAIVRVGNYIL